MRGGFRRAPGVQNGYILRIIWQLGQTSPATSYFGGKMDREIVAPSDSVVGPLSHLIKNLYSTIFPEILYFLLWKYFGLKNEAFSRDIRGYLWL